MIPLLLLLVLAWGFISAIGGLLLQVYYLISSYGIGFYGWPVLQRDLENNSFYCSLMQIHAGRSGDFLFPSDPLFQLDRVFYAGIGYLLVFGIVYSIGRLAWSPLHLIPSKSLVASCFKFQQGILSMLVTLFVLQMTLTILATIP